MLSKRGQVKLGIFIASILYLLHPIVGNPSSQYSGQFEKMDYEAVYCEYIDGSWIITLVMKNYASRDCSVWLENVYEGENSFENLVFDVIHLEIIGKTIRSNGLRKENAITVPPGGYGFIQFSVPEKTIIGDVLRVIVHSAGGMDYIKSIPLQKTSSIDFEAIIARLNDEYIVWYKSYLWRVKFQKMLEFQEMWIISCIWFGILLDGYLIQRLNAYLFDGYIKTRIFRE